MGAGQPKLGSGQPAKKTSKSWTGSFANAKKCKMECCEPEVGGSGMEEAYDLSHDIVRQRIGDVDPEDLKILDGMEADDIVVVRGCYDHIHLVMQHSRIPFRHVTQEELEGMSLRPDQTVYVNCASDFPPRMAHKLAQFVETGGLLITTDWCLTNVVEVAFPGTVCKGGTETGDDVVSVEILDHTDDVLAGFFDEDRGEAAPQWWLEGSSYPIKVLDESRVRKLVVSKEMLERYGEEAVIVRFEHGEGRVYHMLSHFYLQRSETRSQQHQASAEEYACKKTGARMSDSLKMKCKASKVSWGTLQSAATSSEFVMRNAIAQKKRSRRFVPALQEEDGEE